MPEVARDLQFNKTFRFSAAHRLLRRNGFNHVIHAENILDKNFKVFFVRNEENNSRLGIIASKKTLQRASERNYFKRMIREKFRQHKIQAARLDLVVMVRCTDSQERETKQKSLEMLFSRIEKNAQNSN